MTTMALTSPAMRRLFSRLDFAPRPRDAELARALAAWDLLRRDRVAPMHDEDFGPGIAVFIRAERGRDYVLERYDSDLAGLLGARLPTSSRRSSPTPSSIR